MARTEVGSAYVSIYPDTSHFDEELSHELGGSKMASALTGAGEKAGEGFNSGFSAATVALGNLISSAVTGAVDLFVQNLDRGIARLDTIQNFPRLMAAFGYSTDTAAESVQQIQEHLDGLPGSTDDVLRLVQAISDSTGSLELATSTGLAFNDMLTASGADAYTSMMAMRMFDQMMGGAQFTTMRWMALVSKMPLQMNMVAEAILGTGASAQELGNALQNGEVSMQDVAQAMTDLAPQFTTQARAFSYGIGTATRNFGNRVALGVASILDAIGQRRISTTINNISYGIRDALKFVAEGVEWLRRTILVSGVGVLLGKIGDSIKEALANIDWEPLKQFIRDALSLVHDVLQWIIDHGDIVKSILVGIGTAIGAFVIIDTIKNFVAGLAGIITMLTASPLMLIVTAISAVVGGLAYFFTQTEQGKEIWANFTAFLGECWEMIKGAVQIGVEFVQNLLTAAVLFFEGIFEAIIGIIGWVIDKVTNIGETFSNIASVVKDALEAAWKTVKTKWSNIVKTIRDAVSSAFKAVKDKFDSIKKTITDALEAVKGVVKSVWDKILSTIKNVITSIKRVITDIWNGIKSVIEGIVNAIKSLVTGKFEDMKTSASNIFNGIKNLASTIWEGIKSVIGGIVGGIATVASNAWDGMKTVASNAWNSMKTTASNVWNGIKTVASNVWNGIKTTISGVTDGIKKVASDAWNSVKSTASNVWEGIKSTASTVWEGIKGKITAPIESAKKLVGDALGAMQGFIDSLTGKTVKVGVDTGNSERAISNINSMIRNLTDKTLYVDVKKTGINGIDINAKAAGGGWYMSTYAAGGIATKATAGIFGEAGDEALIPLSDRNKVRPFARAVAYEMNGSSVSSNVTVTGNNFYVRSDNDIRLIAEEINRQSMRQMAGRL